MKKFILLLLLCFCCNFAFSLENYPVISFETRFQKVEGTTNDYNFIPITKKEYKTLSTEEKKHYNNMKKSYKYWMKARQTNRKEDIIKYSQKALSYYDLYPLIYELVYFFGEEKDYKRALLCIETLIKSNFKIEPDVYYVNVTYNFALKNYNKCINNAFSFLKLQNISNEDKSKIYAIMANSYYNLEDYENAILYSNKAIYTNKIAEKIANNIKYMAYFRQNKMAEANKVANQLYSWSYPDRYNASMRVAATSASYDTKMKFYNIAKQNAKDIYEIWGVNILIASIDEKKLNEICKKTKGFIEKPLWSNIISNDKGLMDINMEVSRFNDYHNDLNNCMSNYQGNDLKACLKSLQDKQNRISQKLYENMQELNRQIAEEERLRQLRIMNANLQQANYLQQQQNTQLRQLNNSLNTPKNYYIRGNSIYEY